MQNYNAPVNAYHLANGRSAAGATGYAVLAQDASSKIGQCRLVAIVVGTPVNNATITVYDGPANGGTSKVLAVLTENNFSNNEWTFDSGVQIHNGLYVTTSSTADDITVVWFQG